MVNEARSMVNGGKCNSIVTANVPHLLPKLRTFAACFNNLFNYPKKTNKAMKKHLLLLLGLLLALQMPLLTACSDDDDDVATSDVPQAVLTAFAAKYPEATNVKWEKEHEIYKAEYYNADHNEVDVWFNPDGTWLRTETDLLPTGLPEAVQNYVATNHPDRFIDDCDLIEMPGSSYYRLELEKSGAADLYIKLTADGELIP